MALVALATGCGRADVVVGSKAFTEPVILGEMARLLTPYNRLEPAMNADLLRRHGFTGIDPDGRINAESAAFDMNWYLEGGHIERPIDLDQFIDVSYADHAVAQLGPYKPRRAP